jgi:tRNA1Val (adenine37-N6)-methyltransferase
VRTSNTTCWSHDTFLEGHLKVCQSRQGYRFSIDAAILAFHALPDKADARILDLGTGCGIMPLIIAFRHPEVRITGVEIQAELAALARKNVEENRLQSRIKIIEGDFLHLKSDDIGPPVDMVVTNPPYHRRQAGRMNPHNQRAIARHEIAVSLDGLIKSIRRFLTTGGHAWLIYPAERLAELIAAMQAHHLEPKYLRMIHSRVDAEAKQCLLKVVKAGRPGLIVGPPLFIYADDGGYTADAAAMLRP